MPVYQYNQPDRLVGQFATSSPGTGWTVVASLATLVTNARTANLPLFLLPGTYPSLQIAVSSGTGGGNPLVICGVPGATIIQLSGADANLLAINDVNNVVINDIAFDGGYQSITDPSNAASLVNVSGAAVRNLVLNRCSVYNSTKCGISFHSDASGVVSNSTIFGCDIGIFSIDASVKVDSNVVAYCTNNGIAVWTSAQAGNFSTISNNTVRSIDAQAGGTGQNGNGISVYRAGGVKILNNTVSECHYSAIRLNGASDGQVIGNYCWGIRETAIYFEAPGSDVNLTGGICSNNIINGAGTGIAVVNSGLYDDGISRKVTVSNNQISTVTANYLPVEGYNTLAAAIVVEGSCNVVGNNIENAENYGIILGTNEGTTDLLASGNYIHSCPLGIGYSVDPAAVRILIDGNLISDFTVSSDPSSSAYAHSGAIVAGSSIGSGFVRNSSGGTPNIDYGNATQTIAGPLTVGMNKAS